MQYSYTNKLLKKGQGAQVGQQPRQRTTAQGWGSPALLIGNVSQALSTLMWCEPPRSTTKSPFSLTNTGSCFCSFPLCLRTMTISPIFLLVFGWLCLPHRLTALPEKQQGWPKVPTLWDASVTTTRLRYPKWSARSHWSHEDDGSEAGLRKGPTAPMPKVEIDKPGQQHTAWETLPSLSSLADKTSKESMHKIHGLLLCRRGD